MSKSNTFENEWLEHTLNNQTIPGIGDAAGLLASAANGDLYMSLHTADPGEAGTQLTNETAYTGYARVACNRDGAFWTVTGNSASPAANIDFGECTASPGAAITHFALGTASLTDSPASGKILYYGTMTPNITMAVGVIPRFKTTSTITED
jgi:hypothetical protein